MLKSLRSRIILLFIVVIIIQVTITGVFVVGNLKPHLASTYSDNQENMTSALMWEINNVRRKYEGYSLNILADKKIQRFLKQANTVPNAGYSSGMTTELRNLMLSYINYDNAISRIYLVDDQERIYSNIIENRMEEFVKNKLLTISKSDGKALWNTEYNNYIILYRVINDVDKNLNHKIGAIFMVIDKRAFNSVIDKFISHDKQQFALYSDDGYMKFGNNDDLQEIYVNSDRYAIWKSKKDNWNLYIWIPKATMYGPIANLLLVLLGELFCALLVLGLLAIFVSGRITKPIADIKNAMKKMGKGHLGIEVPVTSEDEIGELAKTLNRMSKEIENLILRIKDDEKTQRYLELRTMQYQINPHFLYNTLDQINMITRKNNDMISSELVTSLSNLFRISLSHGREIIKLSDEILHVSYYLKIQSVRFSGQFEWKINVQEDLNNLLILKFILQPLVENSLNHGIRNSGDYGCIWINVYEKNNRIMLEVKDNGIGMMPETLDKVRASLEDQSIEKDPFKGGFGLKNVNQRLKLYYGEDSGLNINSVWEEGTEFFISIPREKAE